MGDQCSNMNWQGRFLRVVRLCLVAGATMALTAETAPAQEQPQSMPVIPGKFGGSWSLATQPTAADARLRADADAAAEPPEARLTNPGVSHSNKCSNPRIGSRAP